MYDRKNHLVNDSNIIYNVIFNLTILHAIIKHLQFFFIQRQNTNLCSDVMLSMSADFIELLSCGKSFAQCPAIFFRRRIAASCLTLGVLAVLRWWTRAGITWGSLESLFIWSSACRLASLSGIKTWSKSNSNECDEEFAIDATIAVRSRFYMETVTEIDVGISLLFLLSKIKEKKRKERKGKKKVLLLGIIF